MSLKNNITADELTSHATKVDCWISLYGIVLEVDTNTLREHPGGAASILRYAGKDCTKEFEDIGHSDTAREWCDRLKVVGRLLQPSCINSEMGATIYHMESIPRAAEVDQIPQITENKTWSWNTLQTDTSNTINTDNPMRNHQQKNDAVNNILISNIFIYPIKACAGVELRQAKITQKGFEHDREYVLVTEDTSTIDGKEYHNLLIPYDVGALSLIHPDIPTKDGIMIRLRNDGVASHVDLCDTDASNHTATDDNTKPNMLSRSMFVSRIDPKTHSEVVIRKYNHIDKCEVEGVDQGDDVANYISEFLKQVYCDKSSSPPRVRLLRFHSRKLFNSERHTAKYAHPQAANYAPFMFTSETTMKMLNRLYVKKDNSQLGSRSEPLLTTIKRYRPNIVFRVNDSCIQQPFEEDSWERVEVENFPSICLKAVKSCGRCSHIFVNPSTAECDGEFIHKRLRSLGRDAAGMMKKVENKIKMYEMKNNIALNNDSFQELGSNNVNNKESLIATIDPIPPRFYKHYEKFVKKGKLGKLFLGVCAMSSIGVSTSCIEDSINTLYIGQKWRAVTSTSDLNRYTTEMSRNVDDNQDVIQDVRSEDLLVKYGKLFVENLSSAPSTVETKLRATDTSSDYKKNIPLNYCELLSKDKKNQRHSVKVSEVI